MRNLYLLQKTSILDDRFESSSCPDTVIHPALYLYRPLGHSFSETWGGVVVRAVTWNPLQIRPNLFLMMAGKFCMFFYLVAFALN